MIIRRECSEAGRGTVSQQTDRTLHNPVIFVILLSCLELIKEHSQEEKKMKSIKRYAVMLAAALLITGLFAPAAHAAVKTTASRCVHTEKLKTIKKSAAKVKVGTTNLTVKMGEGYLKFTAPATRTYKFSFSKVTGKYTNEGYVQFYKKDPSDSTSVVTFDVSTKGGKTDTLHFSINGVEHQGGSLKDRPLPSRTGKVKLKKGQVIYMYYQATPAHSTAKLVIK